MLWTNFKKKFMKWKSILLVFLLISILSRANAQESSTLYFMYSIPQSNLLNPAVQIPCKVFVGMPLLSSIHFDYSNTYGSYNDLLTHSADGTLMPKIDYLANTSPGTTQEIFVEFHISLLNFGFKYKSYYFNFNLSDKVDAGIGFPTNLFVLPLKGNRDYEGKTMSIDGLKVFGKYYREWAFGVSKIMDNQLTLGVKAKLLFGKAGISTSESNVSLYTDPNVYYLTAITHLEANISPATLTIEPNGRLDKIALPPGATPISLLLNSQNKGFAFDFGAIYKYDEKITLSASLLDLGFIHWKYAPNQVIENGQFQFNGFRINPVTNQVENTGQIIDSMQTSYKFVSKTNPFNIFLSPILYLGGTYALVHNLNGGLMLRNELYQGKLLSSTTASLNAWYNKYVGGSLSWSYINGSFSNIGLGLSARTPGFGFYAVSDNVYGMFKWKSAQLLNLRFGFNFLFGCSQSNNIKTKGCAIYRDAEERNSRFALWKGKLLKSKKKRKAD